MYTSFYDLKKKPFQISSDPSFMWFGEKHKEALATLKYGILDNKGFLLLTGDVGTGKTTLINSLLLSLSDDIISTSVPDPSLEKLDFFNFIAASFGIDKEFKTKGTFIAHFRNFLLQANEENKKVLLIIDEAQLLTQELLEEIRLLSNIEKMDSKLINIFFVGQNEFNEILNREQNRAVRQRLTLNYNIDPLTPDETAAYINHRLKVAGASYQIFDDSAAQEIFMYSGGFPRRINVICDHSLLSGYVKEEKIINAVIVGECAKELKIPAHVRNRDINGLAYYDDSKPAVYIPRSKPIEKKDTGNAPTPVQEPQQRSGSGFRTVFFILLFLVVLGFVYLSSGQKFTSDTVLYRFNMLKDQVVFLISGKTPGIPLETGTIDEPVIQHGEESAPSDISAALEANKAGDKIHSIPAGEQDDTPMPSMEPQITMADESLSSPTVEQVKPQGDGTGEPKYSDMGDNKPVDHGGIPQPVTHSPVLHASGSADETDSTLEPPPEADQIVSPLPDEKIIVRFKYDTNDFTEEGYENLLKYAETLMQYPDKRIRVTGYTDSGGYSNYNRKLSEFRANIVRSFLLGRGIKPEQVDVHGLGSENPIESNDTVWGRTMNRRVEIEVIDG